jgi:NAD(P)-dependent dehydrogenase (short-subunit alcohol dehydrogenase family)
MAAGRLEGKTALITGAGSGIGRASARLFASEGARVACVDLDSRASETAGEIGGDAIGMEADVTNGGVVQAMVQAVLDDFGRLDILFNNAGTSRRGKLHETDEDHWDAVLNTNLRSVYLCSRAVLPHMLERGKGTIVNTASALGILAFPGQAAYCASKAAVIMLTKQMSIDYGPAVRVNCVCPGGTDTPMLRRAINRAQDPAEAERRMGAENGVMNRLATPLEIARAALFLASDDASFITGHSLLVDGGMTIDA